MSDFSYLIVHKDHPIDLHGVNSGAETATLWLARTLAEMGKRVVVAAQLVGSEETIAGVQYWDLGPTYDVVKVIERARELGAYHLFTACRATALIASAHETQCVGRYFMAHDPSATAIGVRAEVLAKLADKVICVSEAQKALFVEQGIPADLAAVVPNGANQKVFAATDFSKRDLKRIVFAGALVADKGIDILVRAFAMLSKRMTGVKLDVYGSAKMWGRNELFDQRSAEQQIPGLKFHGSVSQEEVAAAFGTAACNVIPSRWFDSFPLTAVEAQSTGCPVVAFNVGGISEALLDGKTGILVPEVNEQLLSDALYRLLSDRSELARMSKAAEQLVSERFSWQMIAQRVITICDETTSNLNLTRKKVGVLTRWNQQCGLATYAKYLFSNFDPLEYTIFSEKDPIDRTAADESNVVRCWRRDSDDFSSLIEAVLTARIGVLHLNLHSVRFIPTSKFAEAIAIIKARGIKTVLHLHSTFTHDPLWSGLIAAADKLIVHAEQNKLQLVGEGAGAEKVFVLPHGVDKQPSISETDRQLLKQKLALPEGEHIITSFGFIQPHKGVESIIDTVAYLKGRGIAAHGVIVGEQNRDDKESASYRNALGELTKHLGLQQHITFLDRFVSNQEVTEYLQASDLVIMNYRSQHFEASGACALAVGAGAPVITSLAPQFSAFGDAVWQITSGYPVEQSVEILLTNSNARETLRQNATRYSEAHSWQKIAATVKDLYRRELNFIPTAEAPVERDALLRASDTAAKAISSRTNLRVLIQNRSNTFTCRGGDTVVLEHTVKGLEKLGVDVTVDLEGKAEVKDFDLVHLFNFALPDLIKALGERAKSANVPFVVTTLYEDVPIFHNQSRLAAACLAEYVRREQNPSFWSAVQNSWLETPRSDHFDNRWVTANAAALITNGNRESEAILRDYPTAKNVIAVPLGCEVGAISGPELFFNTYGVKDFVLCVGRVESRKNQLMLLKALENDSRTVVIAGGGFTFQPDYAEAVRKFKRKGETLVLDRLSAEMLSSAYAAATVHVLPSWYELPGLVSLEAAAHGTQIVATDFGTSRDYLGDCAFYCDPGDPVSIRDAIDFAYRSPRDTKQIVSMAQQFRWSDLGLKTFKVYEEVLGCMPMVLKQREENMGTETVAPQTLSQPASTFGSFDMSSEVAEFQELVERGELAAKSQEFAKAHDILAKAETMNPQSVRLLKARGTVYLAESQTKEARAYFERAWSIDPHDPRVLCGLGMCELRNERAIEAYRYFIDALAIAPDSQVAILQLIPCAYALGRFDDLERALRTYLDGDPDDNEMAYCLAGCLYRTARYAEAEVIAEQILSRDPANARATEILQLAKVKKASAAAKSATVQASPVASMPGAPVAVAAVPVAPASMAKQEQASATPDYSALAAKADAAINKLIQPKASAATVIEKITVPTAQNAAGTPSSRDEMIDMRVAELEEAKRQKKLEVVEDGCKVLLADRDRLSTQNRELVMCLQAETAVLKGEIEEGLEMYRKILDLFPASPRALSGKGVILAHQNQWAEARSYFERANSHKPQYDLALAGLALCAWSDGDQDLAFVRFKQALKSNPENSRALLGLMQTGYPMKRFGEVEDAIKAYLESHPADLEWVYSLAGCLFAQGKMREATEALDQIQLFNPNDERAIELRNIIQEKFEENRV